MIHCRFASLNWRSVWIDGSATFTIVASRMTMNCARQIRTRTTHGFVARRLTTIPTYRIVPGFPSLRSALATGCASGQPAVAIPRRLAIGKTRVGLVRVARRALGARVMPHGSLVDRVCAPVLAFLVLAGADRKDR